FHLAIAITVCVISQSLIWTGLAFGLRVCCQSECTPSNKSLDASRDSVFRVKLYRISTVMRFTSHFRIAHGEFNHLPRLLWFIFVIGSISVQAQSIEQVLRERVNSERNQTSIVVAVVDEKGTKFFSYGKTAKQPHAGDSNENTVFEIGSLTKVF